MNRTMIGLLFVGLLAFAVGISGCGGNDVADNQTTDDRSTDSGSPDGSTDSASNDEGDDDRFRVVDINSLPPEMRKDVEALSIQQSQGLNNAEVVIHRVFKLKDDRLELPDDLQVVAIDAEFKQYGSGFDIDDIVLVDADTKEGLTYCGESKLLKPDGSYLQNREAWKDDGNLRLLLVFYVSKDVKNVELSYWEADITDKAYPIGPEAELQYDYSAVIPGLEFWKYPASYQYGDNFEIGRWLMFSLSRNGVAVIDLEVWPPQPHHWKCGLLQDIQPMADGSWLVITRTDDYEFQLWQHPPGRPGTSQPGSGEPKHIVVHPVEDENLWGICVLEDRIFAYDSDSGVFEYLPDPTSPQLKPVDLADQPEEGSIYTATLGTGKQVLLVGENGYELKDGRFANTWPLNPSNYFYGDTAPAEGDAFYYVSGGKVWLYERNKQPRWVLRAFNNVQSLRPGPEGSLLFDLGYNDMGAIAGIWFPKEDTYVTLLPGEIDPRAEHITFSTLHWSEANKRFYLDHGTDLATIPGDALLSREHVKLPDAKDEEEEE